MLCKKWYNISILFVYVANIKRKTEISKYLKIILKEKKDMTTRRKITIGVVAVVIAAAIILLIWSPWKKEDSQDNAVATTTEAVTDNSVVIQTSPESKWQIIEPRLVLYFKTESGFTEVELTENFSDTVDEAKTFKVSDKIARIDGRYVEPEVRLYGVPLGAYVSVTCESMATKAYYATIGQNDGAYQYYYWQPRMHSVSEEGEYTFKLTIKETEGSETEKIVYYKIAV